MRVLFLFLDGVGLAERPEYKPAGAGGHAEPVSVAERAAAGSGGNAVGDRPGDCGRAGRCLGVPGTPQSATGQATSARAATCRRRSAITMAPNRIPPSPRSSTARTARTATTCFSRCKMPASGVRCGTPIRRATLPPSPRSALSGHPAGCGQRGPCPEDGERSERGAGSFGRFYRAGWSYRQGLPETPLLTPAEAGMPG